MGRIMSWNVIWKYFAGSKIRIIFPQRLKCLFSNFYKTIQNSIGNRQILMCNVNAIERCAGIECTFGLEFRWLRLAGCENNGIIQSRGRFRISGSNFEIAQMQNHDAGLWGCAAYRRQRLIGYKIFQFILNSQNFSLNCANSVAEKIEQCAQNQICEAKETHQPNFQQSTTNTYRGCTIGVARVPRDLKVRISSFMRISSLPTFLLAPSKNSGQ